VELKDLILPSKSYEYSWFDTTGKILLFGKPHNFADFHNNEVALNIITKHAPHYGLERIYAPSVTSANRLIVGPDEFTQKVSCNGVSVFFGISADGVKLPPRSAFFIASADCPTLVLQSPEGEFVATHAGRKSLVDDENDEGGVVFSALNLFSGNASQTYASVFCGISAEHFNHPIEHSQYGNKNRKLIAYICKRWGRECFGKDLTEGNLNLFELISAQLKKAGVSTGHIWHDGACTYKDIQYSLNPMWWSHRRGDVGRNGILVMRLN